jgi:hypothetical protein
VEADVPSADLPLRARIERLAAPLRSATVSLAARLEDSHIRMGLSFLTAPQAELGTVGELSRTPRERAARSLVAVWLLSQLRRDSLGAGAGSVSTANSHFWGVETKLPEPDGLGKVLAAVDRHGEPEAEALLPYLLDPFGPTDRLAVRAGVGNLEERRARKRAGTFYTPGDVARLLVAEVVADRATSAIDPACGAGVFLRAAFSRLCCELDVPPERALACLYGIDRDPCAIDACGLVLVHDWLAREPDRRPGGGAERWGRVRRNLAVGNSLEAFAGPPARASVWRRFGERAVSRFGCVLMNPPFAPTGKQAAHGPRLAREYETLAAASNPIGVNQAWPFAELALRACGRDASMGIVLPLSIAYRRDPATSTLRRLMAARGDWRLRFFDRAPDAVFGDDVKQRVCIATAHMSEGGSIATSRLIRWSSARRDRVFHPGVGAFQDCAVADGAPLPKIGSSLEAAGLARLRGLAGTLGDGLVEARLVHPGQLPIDRNGAIAVAPTAYNWIGVYRDVAFARAGRQAATGKLSLLLFAEERQADAAYGLLASRVFLWWWRVTGDLFHVPLGTLTAAPFPLASIDQAAGDALAAAGRALWSSARANAVTSTNRGVAITSYRAPLLAEEISAADRAVVAAFGLPARFARFAASEAVRLAGAGRGGRG